MSQNRFFEYLYKSHRMSERVKIYCRCWGFIKLFFEIPSSVFYLSDKRFTRQHCTIRLKVPTAHNMPFSIGNQLLYTPKQFRFIFLNPLIQKCFVVIKYKSVNFLTKVRSGAECRDCLRRSLLPLSQSYRVYVCVA